METIVEHPRRAGRHLALWQFALIVLVYLAIIQAGGRIAGAGIHTDAGWETAGGMLDSALIPIALSAVLAIAVATWLRWWPLIVHEPLRVQGWVGIVPVALLLTAVVGSSWGNLLDQRAELVLALVALVLVVGFTEELMFRGIGLEAFRRAGFTEGKVALLSSVVFGAVHLSNVLGTGTSAIGQAAAVSFTGYLLYLTRRRAGAIWLCMPVHASQDFVILSGQVGTDPEHSPLTLLVVPVMVGLAVLLWRRRGRIEH